ncbi:MAG TPA: hypothetical protein VJL60_03500 [Gammaproteobacteria bacterium]|nr:hypothetical protein [Gammaproteobacteria bacterium]
MAAVEPFCRLIGIYSTELSKKEIFILEAVIFTHIYEELNALFKLQHKNYFHLIKFNEEMENAMLEANFVRCLINDILSTGEYSLSGIANYTNIPEDVIYEIASGINTNPSLVFSRKIIELHRSVRPQLYQEIVNKIIKMSGESFNFQISNNKTIQLT